MFKEFNSVFNELNKEENKYSIKILQGDFSSNYPFGVLCGKFIEKEEQLINLIQYVIEKSKDKNCQNYLVGIQRSKYNREINSLELKISQNESDFISKAILKHVKELERELSFEKMMNNSQSIFNGAIAVFQSDVSYFKEKYPYFCLIKLLYEEFKNDRRFDVPENNNLEKIYQSNSLKLKKINAEYNTKYKLISIDDNFEIKLGFFLGFMIKD